MKASDILIQKGEELREVMASPKHAGKFANLRVYGSVVRGTDTEESDIDFLVDSVGEKISLLDIGCLYSELEDIAQTNIDLTISRQIPKHLRKIIEQESIQV